MRRELLFGIVLAVSCTPFGAEPPEAPPPGGPDGSVVSDLDASADVAPAPPACDLTKPFGAHQFYPAPIDVSMSNERSGSPSADGLTLYFCSDRKTAAAGAGGLDLYAVTRPSLTGSWGTPALLTSVVSPGDECDPVVSYDGRTLYFASLRGGSAGWDVYSATRADVNAPFGSPVKLTALATPDDDWQPWPSADGKLLYFASAGTLMVADLQPTIGNRRMLASLGSSSNESPVLTADELTIYWSSPGAGGESNRDIWTARRATKTSDFENPTVVSELSSPRRDWPTWISGDGCQIIVETGQEPNLDLYFAERPK